jgi:magnesium transporter
MPIFCHPSPSKGAAIAAEELSSTLSPEIVWIDLLNATPAEVTATEKHFGISLPTREEMREIESTSRLYCEDDARFLTTPLLVSTESEDPHSTEIGFVFVKDHLLTIRNVDPHSFKQTVNLFAKRPQPNRDQVFVALIEAMVDRQADLLERLSKEMDELSHRIFSRLKRAKESENNLRDAIYRLGRSGDLIGRERDCIVGLTRLVQYAGHDDSDGPGINPDCSSYQKLRPIMRDLQSLAEFAGFLASKVSFMLDATLGLINIEQNTIVKIFTVAAVIFLPPTLVASIYGMNFDVMPELRWQLGYPFAILVMACSVALPFWFCRRKGWL